MHPSLILTAVISLLVSQCANALAQHQDIFVGHSPPDPNRIPTPGNPCPTTASRKLFVADHSAVGGSIPPDGGAPADLGAVINLAKNAINAPLSRPEFGGFVFGGNQPGLNFIDPANTCHGMSPAAAGGSFIVRLERSISVDPFNFTLTDNFGVPILLENGTSWTFGSSSSGGHVHPIYLAYRPGNYLAEFRLTSDRFQPSDPFTLLFATGNVCGQPQALNISALFNADVIDSDSKDVPSDFDGAGRTWLLNGHYGTDRGLPSDGRLEVFQLGGPNGTALLESGFNCIFVDGKQSVATSIDLEASDQQGRFLSMELLIAAAGASSPYTNSDRLVVTLRYDGGADQVVNVRQAAASPLFRPIRDWRSTLAPSELLSVGRSGIRDGGGFVCSTGAAVDVSTDPADAAYFSRVPFPLDSSRELRRIDIGDYTGRGRLGIFAITVFVPGLCRDMDPDDDGDIDRIDYSGFWDCFEGPSVPYEDSNCAVFDPDRTDTVDLRDLAYMQQRFTDRG